MVLVLKFRNVQIVNIGLRRKGTYIVTKAKYTHSDYSASDNGDTNLMELNGPILGIYKSLTDT